MQTLSDKNLQTRLIAITSSFVIGLALMGVKFYAFRITHSSAILSDALESIINVIASAFAMACIIVSAKPPDKSHPYGHGKIEYFSAGFEGALIILAAIGIFKVGWMHIRSSVPLPNLEHGLFILLGASVINLILGLALVRVGKKTGSLPLIADGKHVLTDVYTSGGMLIGLLLVHLTRLYWLDGVIAALIGVNILITGFHLVRQSVAGLMNATDPLLLQEIAALLSKHRQIQQIDIHKLRAWHSGSQVHIDFHLIMPGDFTLEQAHSESDRLEAIINEHFKHQSTVLIHLDPCTDENCPICASQHCKIRQARYHKQTDWSAKAIGFKARRT
ncbi:cation diffusion facilitator family transporter [Desulfococcaceae bacterium HSG7]|nr:cation diffusion facilitator family transporter [Desulfococcaceae bacterium HSG7]